jgi:phage shock protein A
MSQINIDGKKNFWQRPEGIPGAILLVGVLGGLGYLLMQWMPTLIELAENIWYLGAMCAGLFVVGYMLLDKRVRTLIWYFYKSLVRKATGVFIQLDPIAIIEGFLEDLRDKMKTMEDQIGSLKGQIRKIKNKIAEKDEKVNYYYGMAKAAQNKGDEAQRNLNVRKAQREEEASRKFGVLAEKTEKLYTILDKMKRYSGIMVEDIAHEIEMKKEEREIIRTSHSVMKSAVNIINGNSDRKVIFDQAMEFIADDIGMRIGEMERFMDVSADFMNNMDLENAMYEEKGLIALDEWANKVDEKFDAKNYQSPVKSLEKGSVDFKDREKVVITQTNNINTNSNTGQNSKSKYF